MNSRPCSCDKCNIQKHQKGADYTKPDLRTNNLSLALKPLLSLSLSLAVVAGLGSDP